MFSPSEKQQLEKILEPISSLIEKDEPLNSQDFSNEDLRTLYSLAYQFYQSKDYDQAKSIFHQLVISKPLKQKYWLGLGACFQLEKNYTEALKAWGMASILEGDDPMPYFHAAECNFALNDPKQGWNALKVSKMLLTNKHEELKGKIKQLESAWEKEKKGA